MRTHTKIALAFAALAAISGCKNDENKTENTANPEDYVYTQPRSNYDSRPDPYNAKFLIHAENVPLQRAGIDFTATISGYCDSFDQSDLDAYTAACTDYLTQKIQSDALNHHFFTAAKLSKLHVSRNFHGKFHLKFFKF